MLRPCSEAEAKAPHVEDVFLIFTNLLNLDIQSLVLDNFKIGFNV